MKYKNKIWLYLILVAIVALAMAFLFGFFIGFLINKPKPETSLNDTIAYAPHIPYIPRIEVLGSKTNKIIFCESSGNPQAYNKQSGAKGLLQVIPSSEKLCEKGLERKLDMFNPEDNLVCGKYLKEHGGLSHWSESKNCWQ